SSPEARLLACCQKALRSDILVVGHHGSLSGSREALLGAVAPKLALLSAGPHPHAGGTLPHEEVVQALLLQSPPFRTHRSDATCKDCDSIEVLIEPGEPPQARYLSGGPAGTK